MAAIYGASAEKNSLEKRGSKNLNELREAAAYTAEMADVVSRRVRDILDRLRRTEVAKTAQEKFSPAPDTMIGEIGLLAFAASERQSETIALLTAIERELFGE